MQNMTNQQSVFFAELNETPPETPLYDRIVRNILADKPRVTRYQIDWT